MKHEKVNKRKLFKCERLNHVARYFYLSLLSHYLRPVYGKFPLVSSHRVNFSRRIPTLKSSPGTFSPSKFPTGEFPPGEFSPSECAPATSMFVDIWMRYYCALCTHIDMSLNSSKLDKGFTDINLLFSYFRSNIFQGIFYVAVCERYCFPSQIS